ncbi:MAG: hypothetical protein QOG42_1871, partial [Solirubrobacteraceae bacterium]|nr:hypothetical protein [Solirubrobacteraceae bacterium]
MRLVVDDGHARRSLAALPGSGAAVGGGASDAGSWRAAFPVAAGLVESGGVTYALEHAGAVVDLPVPAAASPRAARDDEARR